MRFDDVAINTMLGLCTNKIQMRLAKQQVAQQKADQAAQDKQQKEAERAAQQAQRAARQAQNTLEKMERGRQARNKLLANATSYLATALGGNPETARQYVDNLYESFQTVQHLSQNEAASAVSLAAVKFKGTTPDEFITFAGAVADAALSEPWSLFPVG